MVWFSILLAALLLYLTLRGMDWKTFYHSLRVAQYGYLPLVLVWSSLVYVVRSLRWQVLLSAEKRVPLLEVHWANMAGYLGNNILPARAGEVIRSLYIGRGVGGGPSTSFVLATCLVERLLDVAALVLLGVVSLASLPLVASALQSSLRLISIVGVAGLVGIFLMPRLENLFHRIIRILPLIPTGKKERLMRLLEQFNCGLRSMYDFKRGLLFLLYTGAVWGMDALGTVLTAWVFNLTMSVPQALVLLAALGLSSAIPSTPGAVGVYQFVGVSVLDAFGMPREATLPFILAAQGMVYVVSFIWGGPALLKSMRKPQSASTDSKV